MYWELYATYSRVKMEEDPIVYAMLLISPYPYDVLTVKEIIDLAVRIWGKEM